MTYIKNKMFKRVSGHYTVQLADISTSSDLYVVSESSGSTYFYLPDPSSLLNTNTTDGSTTDTIVVNFARTVAGSIYIGNASGSTATIEYLNGGALGWTNPNEYISCVAHKNSSGSRWTIEEKYTHLEYNSLRTFSSNVSMFNVYRQDQHHSIDTTGNNAILQLPATAPTGGEWRFINFRGNNTVTINTASSQKIYPANTTQINLTAGQSCFLVRGYNDSVGVYFWERMY